MPLVLLALAGVTGLFVGSQIDDKLEQPTPNTPIPGGDSLFSTGNVIKIGALALSGWVILRIAKEVDLV